MARSNGQEPPEEPGLPPGVVRQGSRLVREIQREAADGTPWVATRPVALDLKEAQEKRYDYYHPELGWILQGYKLEHDRDLSSILSDDSKGGKARSGQEDEEE